MGSFTLRQVKASHETESEVKMWTKRAIIKEHVQSLIQNRMQQERSESAREQRTALYKSDQ